MAYERMLYADALCGLGAAVAANGFEPLRGYGESFAPSLDELKAQFQIETYLRRCVNLGTIPARRWPLFGIEPAPVAPVTGSLMQLEDPGLMVSLADFRAWIKASGVRAPERWADALSESIHWNDRPIEGTNVVTGEPKGGRPPKKPDQPQDKANEVALELYKLNGKMPGQKQIAPRLAARYDAAESTVREWFTVRACHEYLKAQKQENP